jgi:hypothetical protein
MITRDNWKCAVAIAAVLVAGGLSASPAAAQQQTLPETYVRSAPVATSATLDVDEQADSPTGLRAGPTPTPEGGLAGSEVGASDQDGFNDTQLNERARLAYPE